MPRVLWTLRYSQSTHELIDGARPGIAAHVGSDQILKISEPSVDLAFDDTVLREVRHVWQRISGQEDGFMHFEDREVGAFDDDEA